MYLIVCLVHTTYDTNINCLVYNSLIHPNGVQYPSAASKKKKKMYIYPVMLYFVPGIIYKVGMI